jgi:hypothetical protein
MRAVRCGFTAFGRGSSVAGSADPDNIGQSLRIPIMSSNTSSKVPVERRVVITGIGVVAPNGLDTETFWKNTVGA